MQTVVTIKELSNHQDQEVTIRGWIYGRRSGGKIIFLLVRDGTGICQCVVEAKAGQLFETAEKLGQESSVIITGKVRKDERAPGGYEILINNLNIIGESRDYPITRKSHGIDFLFGHRHLWLRSRRPTAILRVRHTVINTTREFFNKRGFILVDTPILTHGAGEDQQSLFRTDFFGKPMFLAQTGQLYLESACMALGKVYCFGPTFRAEKSKTRRHLAEFWMVEPEVAFATLDEIMELAEELVFEIVQAVLSKNMEELTLLERNIEPLRNISRPFPRITYSEAVELLRSPATLQKLTQKMEQDKQELQSLIDKLTSLQIQFKTTQKEATRDRIAMQIEELREKISDIEEHLTNQPQHIASAQNFVWGNDLGGSDETIISESFSAPVFITKYPVQAKAFYMKTDPADPRVVLNMDMLAPEGYGEIIGGSQREDDLNMLIQRMHEKNLNPSDYEWYLDLRKYGTVPHGGFGMGIERVVMWLCGLKHVRETIPFPRSFTRSYP